VFWAKVKEIRINPPVFSEPFSIFVLALKLTSRMIPYLPELGLPIFPCKGPASKNHGLCRPYGVCCKSSTLPSQCKNKHMSVPMRLCCQSQVAGFVLWTMFFGHQFSGNTEKMIFYKS
jgi:hypothetical protein